MVKLMKLTHLQKIRLARSMQAPFERTTGKNAFSSIAWRERTMGKKNKTANKKVQALGQ
jgi:hypothetical protein